MEYKKPSILNQALVQGAKCGGPPCGRPKDGSPQKKMNPAEKSGK